jgi:hypothetical protein
MKQVFDRQVGESEKAFAAFRVYLELGPQRSLALTAAKVGKSKVLMERWSRRHHWCERVAAHAANLATVEREAAEALARGKSAEWLKRQGDIREREWEMHESCIEAARRGLKAFMEREKVYANLADISRILEVASKLGRLASGMATDKTELTGEDGGPLRVELSAALAKVYGEAAAPPASVVDVECTSPLPSPPSGEGGQRALPEGGR